MKRRHNERCKECKKAIESLLAMLFGKIKTNSYKWRTLALPADGAGFSG